RRRHAGRCWIVQGRRAIRVRERGARRPGLDGPAIYAERRRFLLSQAVDGIRVVVRIADASTLRVNESDRALEQPRLRRALRHRALEDIEAVLVHRDVAEGP